METFTPEQQVRYEAVHRKVVNGLAMMLQGYREIAVISKSRLDRDGQAQRRKAMATAIAQFRSLKPTVDTIRERITWEPCKATVRAERRLAKLIEDNFLDSWRSAEDAPPLAIGFWG